MFCFPFGLRNSRYENNDNKYNWKGASRAEKYLCSLAIRTAIRGKKKCAAKTRANEKGSEKTRDPLCVCIERKLGRGRARARAFSQKNDDCYSSNQNAYIRLHRFVHTIATKEQANIKIGQKGSEEEKAEMCRSDWSTEIFIVFISLITAKDEAKQTAHTNSTDKILVPDMLRVHFCVMQPTAMAAAWWGPRVDESREMRSLA